MAMFQLDIVTPEKKVYSGQVESLRAPGADGNFGVLPRHQPMLAALTVGVLSFDEAGGKTRNLAISGGFANVARSGVTILAETAELAEEIDLARAQASYERAQARLSRKDEGETFDDARARAALMRALWRLRVAGRQ